MSNIYFTVGPSQTYPTVAGHVKSAFKEEIFSLNHRGHSFTALYQSVEVQLKKLLSIPKEYSVFFLSSGTEGMERVIQNTVEKKSFHVITGTFGDRFYTTAKELGKNAVSCVADPTRDFNVSDIVIPKDTELIAFTHNDTSTGMQIPMKDIYAVGAKNPNALIAIDTVSSMPAVAIDYTKVDCVFFSVQKGFGLPAGLGILIVSPRAMQKAQRLAEEGIVIGSYHNFLQLAQYAQKNQTPDTPNVLGIYLLDQVLGDFLKIGSEKIRQDTAEKAQMLYDYFASDDRFAPVVTNTRFQSETTLVIEVQGGSEEIQEKLKQQGMIIGSGYGEHKNDHIRIANFPAHSIVEIEGLIQGLKKL